MKKSARSRTPERNAADVQREQWSDRLQAACLLSSVALVTAATLIPSESAADLGSHVVFAMLWLLVLGTWAFSQWLRPVPVLHLGLTGMVLLAFVALHAASAVIMGAAGHARPALNMLWQYVGYAAMFVVLRQVAREGVAIRALASALVALALGLAGLGYYQYFVSMPADVARFEKDPDAVLRSAGINAPEGSPERRQFADRIRSKEPNATFALANSLAGFLTPSLVLVVGLAGWDWLRKYPGRLAAGAVLLAAPLAGCLLLTKSRSAFVGVAAGLIGVAVWDFLRTRLPRWPVLIGGAAGLGTLLVLVTLVGGLDRQVLTEAPKSLLYRMQYWQASAAMTAEYPLLGCGPGNFKQHYTRHKLPEASESISDPHNFLLEIGATAGLPALFVFVGIAAAAIYQLRRSAAEGHPASDTERMTNIPTLVYSGLATGIVLSVPLGALAGFPINVEMLLVCLPLSGLAVWLLHRWVLNGQLAIALLACALVALLINFLAAGGIGYPGVGQIVWVLLALLLSSHELGRPSAASNAADAQMAGGQHRAPARSGRQRGDTRRGQRAVSLTLAVSVLLLAACFFTAYRPVLAAHRHVANAMQSRDWQTAERECRSATEADPWWSEPWELLADLAYQRWQAAPSRGNLQEFELFATNALEADPHSSRLHRRCGDWWLQMFRRNGAAELGQRAVAAYRRAAELYPNSGILHAQLAWALRSTGQAEEAAAEAEQALALDRLTPHEEYWLRNQRLVGALPTQTGSETPANAEQMMLKLRNSDKED